MANSKVTKVQISGTDYDISPSPSGILINDSTASYTSNDVAQDSATSYVSVDAISASDTNTSIFGKITSMIRNIRYLYNKLGTTDISGISSTVTGAVSSLNTSLAGKAAASHSHTTATLPVSSQQVNSTSYIPTSSLVYNMNNELTLATEDTVMGEDFTTNISCGGIESGTSITSTDRVRGVVKNLLYKPTPSTEYESVSLGTWSSLSDVNTFFTNHTPANGWSGLKIGNYVTIQDGTYNTQWEIAGFNLEHNQTAADGTTYDNGYGICFIPKTHITSSKWNSSSKLTGAYKSSYIHSTTLTTTVYNAMSTILGSHLIQRNVLLSSNVSSSYQSSAYTWTTAYFTLMSVGQLNNTFASHKNKYDDGEANYYFPLFSHENYYTGSNFWVRNVVGKSGSYYYAYTCGTSGSISTSTKVNASGVYVRPLMYLR